MESSFPYYNIIRIQEYKNRKIIYVTVSNEVIKEWPSKTQT